MLSAGVRGGCLGAREPPEALSALGRPEALSGQVRRLAGLVLFPFSLGLCPRCFLIVVLSTVPSSPPPCPSHFFFLSSVSPAVPRSLHSRALPHSVSWCPAWLGLFSAVLRLRAGRGQTEAGQVLEIHPSHPGWGRVGRTGRRSSRLCPCHSQCPLLLLASTRCR